MTTDNIPTFGKIRNFLWPIHKNEFGKFIRMFLIFFLIAFNYNILRSVKDTLVVTAKHSGAEAIPFIKFWVILPMALLITYIFTKLSNKYSREKVIYIMLSIFLGFFILFAFFLYPFRDVLHPNLIADKMELIVPQGLKGFLAIFRNWTFTSFYVMAELWGSAILSVLFWGFANEVTSISQAKRFYAIFGVGANISGILSGQAAIYLSSNVFKPWIHYGTTAWEQSILYMTVIILISGFVIIGLFKNLHMKYSHLEETSVSQVKAPKIKMSLKENFAYLAKSKYLICIALIVLSYNLTTHIAEVVWKNQVKQLYPNPSEFNIYMGQVMKYIGVVATVVAIFLSSNFLRKFSWSFSALITPVIVLITGMSFFSFLLFKDQTMTNIAMFFGSTPLIMSVFFGAAQTCLSRASKYTLFDATKEIAFIPLDRESKLKGKAAIDGVGSRLGKSGGSMLVQGFIIMFSSIGASTPYIAILFIIILAVWLVALLSLGKQFNIITSKKETIHIPTAKPALESEHS